MKSLTLFIILFIIKSSVSKNNLNKYSVNPFISNLKSKGTFKIIQSIKLNCGDDVAIITCETLNENHSGNCKRLVTNYMSDSTHIQRKTTVNPKIHNNKPKPTSRSKPPIRKDTSRPKPIPIPRHTSRPKPTPIRKNTSKPKPPSGSIINKKSALKKILKEKFPPDEVKLIYDKIIEKAKKNNIKLY